MARSRHESHHSEEITDQKSLQRTFATKSAHSGRGLVQRTRPLSGAKQKSRHDNSLLAFLPRLAHNVFMVDIKGSCVIAAGVMVISLAASASAQLGMPGINLNTERPPLTKEEQEKQKAIDDAYKSAINKVPDKKKPADPWGDIRSPAMGSRSR